MFLSAGVVMILDRSVIGFGVEDMTRRQFFYKDSSGRPALAVFAFRHAATWMHFNS